LAHRKSKCSCESAITIACL